MSETVSFDAKIDSIIKKLTVIREFVASADLAIRGLQDAKQTLKQVIDEVEAISDEIDSRMSVVNAVVDVSNSLTELEKRLDIFKKEEKERGV